ncbi:hypothetical protein CXF85_02790 [Colwellia sp. 75C3]|uniref:HNH endonuclease n=1 Tax=Colwellia sp. 75C3 TaxID=888425 RepID=UPI000C33A0FA|nr:HNH endonuclease [Colwellia sp. 75C3]PKG85733.1 hypothetical protein CXF85_02790 [Colwellia sp. 75C3]
MERLLICRPTNKLTGKILFAHTVASLIILQSVSKPAELSINAPLKSDALKFLIRERAVGHWSSKKNGWIKKVDGCSDYFLTQDGLNKVLDRVNGKSAAQSVTVVQIDEALARIRGELKDYELDEYSFYSVTKSDLDKDDSLTPIGNSTPDVSTLTKVIVNRLVNVKEWVLKNANGICEACNSPAPFCKDDKSPYLEVHHVQFLSEGGSDTVKNAVALCPNCHRKCHHSFDKKDFKERLYKSISRLVLE